MSDDDFTRRFEIFANEQAAEVEALRNVLQMFVVTILTKIPDQAGSAIFESLRTETLKRLSDEIMRAGADQDAIRKAEFVHLRATRIFDEMAPVFGLAATGQPHRPN